LPRKGLRALVGKQVRIERDGVGYDGMLVGEVYRHVRSRKTSFKRWLVFRADERAKGLETYFKGGRRLDRDAQTSTLRFHSPAPAASGHRSQERTAMRVG
jgi:hypothetical protein